MAMTVRELLTKWGFVVDDKQLKEADKSVSNLKSGLVVLGATVAGAAATIFGFAKTTAHAGEEAGNTAKRLGINVEELQKLQFAAELANVTNEEFTLSMGLLNRQMFEAKNGNKESAKAFGLLGSKVVQSVRAGESADVVFANIADSFERIEDPAKRAAIAQQLFGRGGQKLIPLLTEGSAGLKQAAKEADELGFVLSEKTVVSAKRFEDSLKTWGKAMIGIRNLVGAALLDPLSDVIEENTAWFKANRKIIAQQLTDFLQGLADILKVTFYWTRKVASAFVTILTPLGGIGKVLKTVVALMAIFAAGQILIGIGQMAIALFNVAKAFRIASLWTALFNAQALLIPLLIGAAIVLLILAIEDLIGFFIGKDSLTGVIVDAFKNKFPEAFGFLKYLLDEAIAGFIFFKDTVLAIFNTVGSVIKTAMGAAAPVLNALGFGGAATAAVGSISPATSPVAGGNTSNQTAMNVQAPVQVTVQAPPNGDPHAIGDATADGVQKGMDRSLRQAHTALAGGVAY